MLGERLKGIRDRSGALPGIAACREYGLHREIRLDGGIDSNIVEANRVVRGLAAGLPAAAFLNERA